VFPAVVELANMHVCAEEASFKGIHLPYQLNTVPLFSQSHDNFLKSKLAQWNDKEVMLWPISRYYLQEMEKTT
jgi:hypothetical protein